MSASEVEQPRRHESVGGVLGVGFGLVLIATLVAVLLGQRARTLDPTEQLERWFEPANLPFGLEPTEAAREPGGEVLLRLEDPRAAPEAPKAEPPQPTPGTPLTAVNWAELEQGPEGTPPTQALFVTWPLAVAPKQLQSLFSAAPSGPSMDSGGGGGRRRGIPEIGGSADPLAGLGPMGGRRVLERGVLPWRELEAPFVVERSFEPGGTFVDTLRVNLSSEHEPLALFLRWPRGLPASTERAAEVLAALHRRMPAAGG